MRPIHVMMFVLLVPLAAVAQNYSRAPIIIGEDTPPNVDARPVPGAEFSNFPQNAISRVGENTTGQHVDVPATPAAPPNPANPPSPATPSTPVNPAAPAAPPSPISKLWPRDTIAIFLPPCTGGRPQFIVHCTCVITSLMLEMPHDEFLTKSEDGTIEQDARLYRIRTNCATAPQQQKE